MRTYKSDMFFTPAPNPPDRDARRRTGATAPSRKKERKRRKEGRKERKKERRRRRESRGGGVYGQFVARR